MKKKILLFFLFFPLLFLQIDINAEELKNSDFTLDIESIYEKDQEEQQYIIEDYGIPIFTEDSMQKEAVYQDTIRAEKQQQKEQLFIHDIDVEQSISTTKLFVAPPKIVESKENTQEVYYDLSNIIFVLFALIGGAMILAFVFLLKQEDTLIEEGKIVYE